jgi:O-antigen/teichoic acid export membrane protein
LALAKFSTLASGVGIGMAGRFLGRFIAALTGVIAARTLGPSDFGLYAVGLALIRMSEVVIPMGFDIGVIKYGTESAPDQPRFKGVVLSSLGIAFGFGALLGTALHIFSGFISRRFFHQSSVESVFQYISIALPFIAVMSVGASATRISQNLKYSFLTQDFGQPFMALILLVALTISGFGLQGALLSEVASIIFSAILLLVFLRSLYPFIFRAGELWTPPDRGYYGFSIASSFSAIFITAILWIDRLILGVYHPPAAVGVYQSAAQLSLIFALILGGMNRILIPMYASLHAAGNFSGVGNLYRVGTRWTIYLGLPIFVIILFRAGEILSVLYGDEYLGGISVLSILLIGQFINLYSGSVAPLLNIAGYHLCLLLFSCIAAALDLILNFVLIPVYGIDGAAASTSVTIGFYYLVLLLFAGVKLKMWPVDVGHVKTMAAFGVFALFILTASSAYLPVSILGIGLELLALYAGVLCSIYFARNRDDMEFFSHIRRTIRKGPSVE